MNIAVVGTGYVGLVTGTCLAETGNQVICVDINKEKVDKMKAGVVPIYEPHLDVLFERNIKQGRLTFTTNLAENYSFKKNVVLTNPQFVINCDTMRYNTSSKVTYFIGPTTIKSKENLIYCEDGWYDTFKDQSRFSKNSYIITKERISSGSIEEAVNKAMHRLKGAYSLVVMSPTKLIAARDEHGFRPLCYGKTPSGDYVVASESCIEGCIHCFLEVTILGVEGVKDWDQVLTVSINSFLEAGDGGLADRALGVGPEILMNRPSFQTLLEASGN